MSAKKPNELIDRYEEMLRGTVSCYFDTDEIDEISDYYESKGQLSKALHAIEFGLNLHPDNVDLKLKEARYMLYLDRADEAKRIMSELADYSLDATLIRAELLFIDGYMSDGHALLLAMLDNDDIREDFCFDAVDIYTDYDCFDELVEFVEKAGKVLPDSRELFREMAAICEERSEYERSVIIYNKLIDKDPYSLQDWFSLAKVEALLKHYDKAVEACDFALAVKENEESIISFKGYCYYDSGQYEKAGKVLPDSRELFREMAAICEERSEYERSVIIYNKLIDKDPYSLQDWFSLAKVEALLKHYDKAVEACDFALAVKENEESIISFKGYCYYDSGQYEKAIEQFLEYESITKEKSVAYELIGECYVKLDDNNNALKFFHKALDIEPSNSNICYQLATCYYELGDIQKAVVYLRDTLSLDSRDDEAHSFLGEILLQEGDYEEAYYHLSKSLELNEDDMETMKLKGEACLHLEYYEEAVSVFETVLREDSYDLHCRLKLALAYAKMGDDANAERQIQIIDQMSQSADFSGLPNEKSQQWKNVHGAIQSLKCFLLDHIDDSENKESLS